MNAMVFCAKLMNQEQAARQSQRFRGEHDNIRGVLKGYAPIFLSTTPAQRRIRNYSAFNIYIRTRTLFPTYCYQGRKHLNLHPRTLYTKRHSLVEKKVWWGGGPGVHFQALVNQPVGTHRRSSSPLSILESIIHESIEQRAVLEHVSPGYVEEHPVIDEQVTESLCVRHVRRQPRLYHPPHRIAADETRPVHLSREQ